MSNMKRLLLCDYKLHDKNIVEFIAVSKSNYSVKLPYDEYVLYLLEINNKRCNNKKTKTTK